LYESTWSSLRREAAGDEVSHLLLGWDTKLSEASNTEDSKRPESKMGLKRMSPRLALRPGKALDGTETVDLFCPCRDVEWEGLVWDWEVSRPLSKLALSRVWEVVEGTGEL
jgi:hypothetical protein